MPEEIQKVFVKVVTLDWHDYRCLEQGIMAHIILGLEIDLLCTKIISF